jgi:hypothetical protein
MSADVDIDLDTMGPIDYLVVEFPESRLTGEALPLLIDLVDRGIVRILDLALLVKRQDGGLTKLRVGELDGRLREEFSEFEGATSDLLVQEDFEEVGAALQPGSMAGILIFENRWAAPFASAVRRAGGHLVASGRIPVQSILAALDTTESNH